MNSKLSLENRKVLQAKLAGVFNDELQSLSGEYREILLDDLISAFQNRFEVLSRIQQVSNRSFEVIDYVALEAE
jgi:hypothetical protein